jgi:hypothetical protein
LNVVVTTESGKPVTDLEQKDFTIFDNRAVRAITSFDAVLTSPTPPRNAPIMRSASYAPKTGAEKRGEFFRYEITFRRRYC